MRDVSRISAGRVICIPGISFECLADNISINTTPNEKTSDFSVSWPDKAYSGSRYPNVPDTPELEFSLINAFDKVGGPILDSRKLESLASKL
ncbi:hypothetical protein ACFX15_010291 [Malus domestica]